MVEKGLCIKDQVVHESAGVSFKTETIAKVICNANVVIL